MTILDVLNKLSAGATDLVGFMEKVGEKAPDLKPIADSWIASLNEGIAPDNLVNLASVLPGEIAALAQGKVTPKDHPSDSI